MSYYSDLTVDTSVTNIDPERLDYPKIVTVTIKDSDDNPLYGVVKNPPLTVYPAPTDYCKTTYLKNSSYDISLYNNDDLENSNKRINTISYRTNLTKGNYKDCRVFIDFNNPSSLNCVISDYSIKLYDENGNYLEDLITSGGSVPSGATREIFFILENIEKVIIETTFTYNTTSTILWTNQTVAGMNLAYARPGETLTAGSVNVVNNTDVGMLIGLYGANDNRYIMAMCVCKAQPTGTVTFNANISVTADYSFYNSTYGYYMFKLDLVYGNLNTAKEFKNLHISNNAPWYTNSSGMSENDLLYNLTRSGFPYTQFLNNYVGKVIDFSNTVNISGTFPGKTNGVEGGTEGTFDDSTDTNSIPALPTTDTVTMDGNNSVGSFSIFRLSENEYRFVRECLFSTDFFNNIKNFFTKPLDGIISLGRVPFMPMSAYGSTDIKIGSITLSSGSVHATGKPLDRYHAIDCGSVEILPYWDTALDYNPYTRIIMHLPFIGSRELNTDLVMNKTIRLVYHVDIITGSCVAYVTANNDLIEQYTGNMLTTAPLSGEDFSRVYGSILTSVAQSTVNATLSGSPVGGVSNAISGAANSALHSKREFAGNVNLGGSTSLLENLQPFIEIIRPVQSRPRNYETFKGYVSTVTEILADCQGYTEVLDIHLENISATENEKTEIFNLLKSGVII